MQTLFDGDVDVSYSQLYIYSGGPETRDPLADAFSGQQNGVCGGAWPGFVFLTGLNVGYLPFRVERHDEAPPVDDGWEDIVEVSFRPATPEVALVEWGGGHSWPLDLDPTDLRVRSGGNAWGLGRLDRALLDAVAQSVFAEVRRLFLAD